MGTRDQFTKGELRYLKRKECFMCEARLDRFECCAIFFGPCTQEFLVKRARVCLQGYKPRSAAPGGDGFPITNTEAEVVPGTKGRKAKIMGLTAPDPGAHSGYGSCLDPRE